MNSLTNMRSAMSQLQSLQGRRWYDIAAKATGEETEVLIYDEIGWMGVTAEDFVADLVKIDTPKIRVRINSPGGSFFGGVAIYNALRTHPAEVTTVVDSLAASAASIILQGGDRRVMMQHSSAMIHDAWGLVIGNAAEMEKYAQELRKVNGTIADIYAERAGKPKSMFAAMMSDETWFDHDEAIDVGLADEVLVPERKETEESSGDVAASSTVDPQNSLEEEPTADTAPAPPARVEFGDLFQHNPFTDLLK